MREGFVLMQVEGGLRGFPAPEALALSSLAARPVLVQVLVWHGAASRLLPLTGLLGMDGRWIIITVTGICRNIGALRVSLPVMVI